VKTSELIKKSQAKRGAPGTLKRKIKGKMTIAKAKALKNKPGATTLDKKQANFFINMQKEEMTTATDAGIPQDTKNMGPKFKTYRVLDKRRKKNTMPRLLKRFQEYIK